MNRLLAISPIDGRYRQQGTYKQRLEELSEYVSEYSLIKARLGIEIKYLFALSKIGVANLLPSEKNKLLKVLKNFNLNEAEKIKEIEAKTRHDAKAVEIYLKKFLSRKSAEMVHCGFTGDDVNNLAYRIMLREASEEIIVPTLQNLIDKLNGLAKKYRSLPMLARTHGKAAVPTTLGKEFSVFAYRLNSEIRKLKRVQLTGKANGSVGNYNSFNFIYPKIDWVKFSKNFVDSFEFKFSLITTQINSPEDIIEYFQILRRINGIILDLNQDLWRYVSDGWLMYATEKTQVGSSAMPQKINPIDFESSEGNLEIANGLIEVFERKLPVSRLQRDLSGSTILRNLGVILAHSLFSYKGTLEGLQKVTPNKEQIAKDLNEDWSVLSEALQTYLRRQGAKDSYFKVMEKIKGKKLTQQDWLTVLKELKIKDEKLLKLTPENYTGLAEKLVSASLS
jgi:adenylosuccinate lyase